MSLAVILSNSAIVVSPFVNLVDQTDDHGRRGGWNPFSELIPSNAVLDDSAGRDAVVRSSRTGVERPRTPETTACVSGRRLQRELMSMWTEQP
jgi:hypothetical protein